MSEQASKMWSGRFREPLNKQFEEWQRSFPFDWRLLQNLDPRVPFMLSGGLDAGNVAEAIRITRAGGVDVSSGVETGPGRKDPGLIRAFIEAVRRIDLAKAGLSGVVHG